MNATTAKTPVVFRTWSDGEVIALFPDELWSAPWERECVAAYMHIGQHGPAHYSGVVHDTRPSTPEEYAELLAELVSIGYADLHIQMRRTTR
jgi:hypothetical protein